jgi:hypothetical protein
MSSMIEVDSNDEIIQEDMINNTSIPIPGTQGSMDPNMINIDDTEGDTVDLLIWVLHGINVSSKANYYPFKYKYKSLSMFSKPFSILFPETVRRFFSNELCMLLQGTCPYLPIINAKTRKREVYLPPLLFSMLNNDHQEIIELSGLYHIVIKKTGMLANLSHVEYRENPLKHRYNGKDICKFVSFNKIITHADFIQKYGSGNLITYSILFKHINDYCKTAGLNVAELTCCIFSCQTKHAGFMHNYDIKSTKILVPSAQQSLSLKKSILFEKLPSNVFVSPTIVIADHLKTKDLQLIPGITYQGCGLNVLSYYNIIPENKAREKMTCLDITGTSIFEILDYMNHHFIQKGVLNNTYIIIRLPLAIGIQQLCMFMEAFNSSYNYAIIVKMYETMLQNGTTNDSHVGHTVSFAKVSGESYFIDPQVGFVQKFNASSDSTQITEYLSKTYSKHFIDIIYTIRQTRSKFSEDRPIAESNDFNNFIQSSNAKIIYRPNDPGSSTSLISLNGGDSKKSNKTKSNKTKTKSNKTKSNKTKTKSNKTKTKSNKTKTKSNKTKTSISYSVSSTKDGEEEIIGDYIKLNKQIDKQFKIETLITV